MSQEFKDVDSIAKRLLGTHRFEEPDLADVSSMFSEMLPALRNWIDSNGPLFGGSDGHHYGLGVLWAETGGSNHAAIECQADHEGWMCTHSGAHDDWAYALVVLLVRHYQEHGPKDAEDDPFWKFHTLYDASLEYIYNLVLRYAKVQWEYYGIFNEFGLEIAERYQQVLLRSAFSDMKWLNLFLQYAEQDLGDLEGLYQFIAEKTGLNPQPPQRNMYVEYTFRKTDFGRVKEIPSFSEDFDTEIEAGIIVVRDEVGERYATMPQELVEAGITFIGYHSPYEDEGDEMFAFVADAETQDLTFLPCDISLNLMMHIGDLRRKEWLDERIRSLETYAFADAYVFERKETRPIFALNIQTLSKVRAMLFPAGGLPTWHVDFAILLPNNRWSTVLLEYKGAFDKLSQTDQEVWALQEIKIHHPALYADHVGHRVLGFRLTEKGEAE